MEAMASDAVSRGAVSPGVVSQMSIDQRALSRCMAHSERAMQLARSMSRSRKKSATGRVICHHLRMMLSEDLGPTIHGRAFRLADGSGQAAGEANVEQFSLELR